MPSRCFSSLSDHSKYVSGGVEVLSGVTSWKDVQDFKSSCQVKLHWVRCQHPCWSVAGSDLWPPFRAFKKQIHCMAVPRCSFQSSYSMMVSFWCWQQHKAACLFVLADRWAVISLLSPLWALSMKHNPLGGKMPSADGCCRAGLTQIPFMFFSGLFLSVFESELFRSRELWVSTPNNGVVLFALYCG